MSARFSVPQIHPNLFRCHTSSFYNQNTIGIHSLNTAGGSEYRQCGINSCFNSFSSLTQFKPTLPTSQKNVPTLLCWGKPRAGREEGVTGPFLPKLCQCCNESNVLKLQQKENYSSLLMKSLLLFGLKFEVYCFLNYISHYSHIPIPLLYNSLLGFFTLLFKFQGHTAQQ